MSGRARDAAHGQVAGHQVTGQQVAARVEAHLARRSRPRLLEAVAWGAAVAAMLLLPDRALLLNEIAILALFALSLDLILGFAGIVSLGHAAFFGFGAYAAGILAARGYGDPLLGLGFAALLTAALGFVTSFLIMRGTDLTRIMGTMGVGMMLYELANRLGWLTGGADGLQGVAMTPLLGLFEFDFLGHTAVRYSLGTLFALFVVARIVTSSPFGMTLRAVRGNPLRAAAVGIPVRARLVAVYTLAAAYAGVAGALLAQTTQFVSLDVLDFRRSADVMLMVIIGGAGTLYGALGGAVVFRVMQNWLSGITPQYWEFWIGFLLVVLVMVGHERLMRGLPALMRKALARLKPGGPAAAPRDAARGRS